MYLYSLMSQLVFAAWFFILHFIPVPPLNDIDKYPNSPSWKRSLFIHWSVLMLLIIGTALGYFYIKITLILFLALFMFGHLNSWWFPYLFGWPKVFIEKVQIDHKCTVRFLPARGNRPVPDVAYCILGLTGLTALILTIRSGL